ncbi:MAG: PRTRC system protein C [Cyclobacteriaceae bacterium]
MALQVTNIERSFVLVKSDEEQIPLHDFNPDLSPNDILNFYSGTYPLLTSATIEGPEVIGNKAEYRFLTKIGTKG